MLDKMSFPIDTNDRDQMLKVVNSCIATKFTQRYGTLMGVSERRPAQRSAAHAYAALVPLRQGSWMCGCLPACLRCGAAPCSPRATCRHACPALTTALRRCTD